MCNGRDASQSLYEGLNSEQLTFMAMAQFDMPTKSPLKKK